jgi:hypothetical protein
VISTKLPIFYEDAQARLLLSGLHYSGNSDPLKNLTKMLSDVIDFSKELHMRQLQQIKGLEMEKQLAVYDEKLKNWRKTAKVQVEISYAERTETPFLRGKKEDEIHYIETINSKSSQYNTDPNSLNNEHHLKVIAVFYNV